MIRFKTQMSKAKYSEGTLKLSGPRGIQTKLIRAAKYRSAATRLPRDENAESGIEPKPHYALFLFAIC